MENPYEGQNYRPYTPPPVYEPESAPNSSVYQGNATFATLSLVMGILSILSICCFFPMVFVFSGLGILFSCLSKGEHRRPGNAKAGMAICVSCLTIFTALVIFICTFFLVSDKGQSFLQEYYHLITSDNVTEADLYNLFTNICMEKISCLIRIQTVTILLMDMTITMITSMTTAAMISMTETFLIFTSHSRIPEAT